LKKALGCVELLGYSIALLVMDKVCKAVDVEIQAIDCNKPAVIDPEGISLLVQVKFTGSVEDVKEGLKVAKYEALKYLKQEDIITHYISNFDSGLYKMIKISKVNN